MRKETFRSFLKLACSTPTFSTVRRITVIAGVGRDFVGDIIDGNIDFGKTPRSSSDLRTGATLSGWNREGISVLTQLRPKRGALSSGERLL